MSSFDTAREKWELYHMEERNKYKEAAANGDPEAMEILAYHINKIEYNCHDEVIALLTVASDAGRQTASWKLADYYAHMDGFNGTEHRDKIEHYCRLAFEGGKIYSDKETELMYGYITDWLQEYHPEWCEKKGVLYTYRYGMDVFAKTGAREPLCEGTKLKITDYLSVGEKKKINSLCVPLAVGTIKGLNTESVWKIIEVSDTVVRIKIFEPDGKWLKTFTMEKEKRQNFSSRLVDVGHEYTLELIC